MIVVDTSVLIAILLEEADGDVFTARLDSAERAVLAAPNLFETLMVLSGKARRDVSSVVDVFLSGRHIEIVAFSGNLVPLAHQAFLRFGEGRHPAALNFGDCIAYATAKSLAAPLLFKGADFHKTDIVPALQP